MGNLQNVIYVYSGNVHASESGSVHHYVCVVNGLFAKQHVEYYNFCCSSFG